METKSKKTAQKPKILKFPDGFLWGAATASYQVEGGITNNDWAQSKMPPAGLACDHYHRYEEDFRIAKKLGMNAQRISLEWSRIEPERDVWNEEETPALQASAGVSEKTWVYYVRHIAAPHPPKLDRQIRRVVVERNDQRVRALRFQSRDQSRAPD